MINNLDITPDVAKVKKDTPISLDVKSSRRENMPYDVTLSIGEKSISMSFDQFNRQYFELVKDKISPLLKTIISNLLRTRDHLGLQLNFEFGNIDSDEYEQLEKDFLVEQVEMDADTIKQDAVMLIKLTNKIYNAEELSTMFNCRIEAAELALNQILIEEGEKDVANRHSRQLY